jgi:hypothetical protein
VCSSDLRALATERPVALVVRTAIEIGYSPCLVIRCAIEGGADVARVLQGTGEAAVTADVAARCAVDAGVDRGLVARLFAELPYEPSFCYLSFGPAATAAPQWPSPPVADRVYQPRGEASPFTFRRAGD